MSATLDDIWYGRNPLGACLAPAGWLVGAGAVLKRSLYRSGLIGADDVGVPVIVIGNLTVGGTGKTPLTIWAANRLRQQGYKPGIVCRGYRGRAKTWPQQVRPDSDPVVVGDESVLIARRTGCPVAAGPQRVPAARALVAHSGCDVILSDDGLQHLALKRNIEIAVIDGERRLGNGRCLPAGPLREPAGRLKQVDFVVTNGIAQSGEVAMKMQPRDPVNLKDPGIRRPLGGFKGVPVHAVCGVGNPGRFFSMLQTAGLELIPHAFPDHHDFSAADLDFGDGHAILMTEKDAVKCGRFSGEKQWYVPIEATLPDSFFNSLVETLRQCSK